MALHDRALLNRIKLFLAIFSFINLNLKRERLCVRIAQQEERDCACSLRNRNGIRSRRHHLDMDDPSRDENEELAGTWILEIAVRLENGRDLS